MPINNKAVQFKLYEPRDISGLVTKQNLNYNFMYEPQKATKFAINLFKANVGIDLNVILDQFPTKTYDNEDDITWDLVTGNDKNLPLVKAQITDGTDISATSKTGLAHGIFYLYFSENRFFQTHIIGGEENEKYPIYVMENPTQAGSLWKYKCQLMLGDPEVFIPYEELTAGKRFSVLGAASESELSDRGAGVSHDFPYKMITHMSAFRIEDSMPGSLTNRRPVQVYWKDAKTGKTQTNWMEKWSYDFEMTCQRLKNYLYYYSTSNRAEDGTFKQLGPKGRVIKRGPGLKQQIESSNYYTFNEFDIDKFVDAIIDITTNKLLFNEIGMVMLNTGRFGSKEFHKAIEDRSQYFTPVRNESRIYSASTSTTMKGVGMPMGYGGQFVEYWGPSGVRVGINIDPTKDDPVVNKKKHPTKAGCLESYNYDLYNIGTSKGEPNIQKITLKTGGEIRRYISGLVDPFTWNKPGLMACSNPTDGWEQHYKFVGGVIVLDPSRCLSYKLNIV